MGLDKREFGGEKKKKNEMKEGEECGGGEGEMEKGYECKRWWKR